MVLDSQSIMALYLFWKDKGRFDVVKVILSRLLNKTVDQMELKLF